MKNIKTVAGVVGALALSATPALATNSHAPDTAGTQRTIKGTAHQQATPGPKASMPTKAKAYGKYCQGESKKHVAGTPGTPFSKCVTAMAKVAHDQATAKTACKAESKKHVAGSSKTAFSMCVSGAAKLKQDQADSTS